MAEGAYNPYDNREVEHPLTNCDAFVSLLKCVVGTGILAMPLAFSYGGLVMGTIMTLIATFLIMYGMHLLIQCMVECSRRGKVGYTNFRNTMVYSFKEGPACCRYCAKGFGYMVDAILAFSHFGTCTVYIVFVSTQLQQLLENVHFYLNIRAYCAMVGLCLLPLFFIRHLKYLVPFNFIANILIYFGIAFIFWYIFTGLPGIGGRKLFPYILDVPMFMAIALFAVSSVGVMIAIESKMAKPGKYLGWSGILSLGGMLVFLTYFLFGFCGYWRYGEMIEASITLNVPNNEILALLIKIFIAVAVFFTYPLSGYVPVDIFMNNIIIPKWNPKKPVMVEYIFRFCFVIVTTLTAVAFPNLGPLMGLFGAFSISSLNLIIPCCIELSLLYHDSYGKLKWKLWKDILIIIIGTVVLLYGSYTSIVDIIHAYGSSNSNHKKSKEDSTPDEATTEATTMTTITTTTMTTNATAPVGF